MINSSSKKRCEPFVGASDEFLSVFTVRVCCEEHATTRRHPEEPLNFRVEDLTLELVNHAVYRGPNQTELSARELTLLKVLMREPDAFLPAPNYANAYGHTNTSTIRNWSKFLLGGCERKSVIRR